MAERLEILDGETWEAFVASPLAVLMLSKSDCESCQRWTEELGEALGDASFWPDVRFGKIVLDTRGLTSFKRANPWLGEVDALPFNVIYKGGERVKTFAGSGVSRLTNRLQNVVKDA